MRNPFRHPRQPDAATMHALQVARLAAERDNARATAARLAGEVDALRIELQQAENNYKFALRMYCDNAPRGGKHQ
jgi:hypothetical protein